MNNFKLLHIKCCFFQIFNSLVALKNEKKFGPAKKKLKWCPCVTRSSHIDDRGDFKTSISIVEFTLRQKTTMRSNCMGVAYAVNHIQRRRNNTLLQ